MDYLLLVSLGLFLLTACIGLLWGRRTLAFLLVCFALSLIVGLFLQIKGNPPHNGHLSYRYLSTMLFWFAIPYCCFFLVPCLFGGLAGLFLRRPFSRVVQRVFGQ